MGVGVGVGVGLDCDVIDTASTKISAIGVISADVREPQCRRGVDSRKCKVVMLKAHDIRVKGVGDWRSDSLVNN